MSLNVLEDSLFVFSAMCINDEKLLDELIRLGANPKCKFEFITTKSELIPAHKFILETVKPNTFLQKIWYWIKRPFGGEDKGKMYEIPEHYEREYVKEYTTPMDVVGDIKYFIDWNTTWELIKTNELSPGSEHLLNRDILFHLMKNGLTLEKIQKDINKTKRLLISRGFEYNRCNDDGRTALFEEIRLGAIEAVKHILERDGIELLYIKDENGKTAIEVAEDKEKEYPCPNYCQSTLEYLKKYKEEHPLESEI